MIHYEILDQETKTETGRSDSVFVLACAAQNGKQRLKEDGDELVEVFSINELWEGEVYDLFHADGATLGDLLRWLNEEGSGHELVDSLVGLDAACWLVKWILHRLFELL